LTPLGPFAADFDVNETTQMPMPGGAYITLCGAASYNAPWVRTSTNAIGVYRCSVGFAPLRNGTASTVALPSIGDYKAFSVAAIADSPATAPFTRPAAREVYLTDGISVCRECPRPALPTYGATLQLLQSGGACAADDPAQCRASGARAFQWRCDMEDAALQSDRVVDLESDGALTATPPLFIRKDGGWWRQCAGQYAEAACATAPCGTRPSNFPSQMRAVGASDTSRIPSMAVLPWTDAPCSGVERGFCGPGPTDVEAEAASLDWTVATAECTCTRNTYFGAACEFSVLDAPKLSLNDSRIGVGAAWLRSLPPVTRAGATVHRVALLKPNFTSISAADVAAVQGRTSLTLCGGGAAAVDGAFAPCYGQWIHGTVTSEENATAAPAYVSCGFTATCDVTASVLDVVRQADAVSEVTVCINVSAQHVNGSRSAATIFNVQFSLFTISAELTSSATLSRSKASPSIAASVSGSSTATVTHSRSPLVTALTASRTATRSPPATVTGSREQTRTATTYIVGGVVCQTSQQLVYFPLPTHSPDVAVQLVDSDDISLDSRCRPDAAESAHPFWLREAGTAASVFVATGHASAAFLVQSRTSGGSVLTNINGMCGVHPQSMRYSWDAVGRIDGYFVGSIVARWLSVDDDLDVEPLAVQIDTRWLTAAFTPTGATVVAAGGWNSLAPPLVASMPILRPPFTLRLPVVALGVLLAVTGCVVSINVICRHWPLFAPTGVTDHGTHWVGAARDLHQQGNRFSRMDCKLVALPLLPIHTPRRRTTSLKPALASTAAIAEWTPSELASATKASDVILVRIPPAHPDRDDELSQRRLKSAESRPRRGQLAYRIRPTTFSLAARRGAVHSGITEGADAWMVHSVPPQCLTALTPVLGAFRRRPAQPPPPRHAGFALEAAALRMPWYEFQARLIPPRTPSEIDSDEAVTPIDTPRRSSNVA
jgi:hypothetical protein